MNCLVAVKLNSKVRKNLPLTIGSKIVRQEATDPNYVLDRDFSSGDWLSCLLAGVGVTSFSSAASSLVIVINPRWLTKRGRNRTRVADVWWRSDPHFYRPL